MNSQSGPLQNGIRKIKIKKVTGRIRFTQNRRIILKTPKIAATRITLWICIFNRLRRK
jgi:hypothetical protein